MIDSAVLSFAEKLDADAAELVDEPDRARRYWATAALIRSLLAETNAWRGNYETTLTALERCREDREEALQQRDALQTENERLRNSVECTGDHDDLIHQHCDFDPLECSVQALQGEYDERGRKLTALEAENERLRRWKQDMERHGGPVLEDWQRLENHLAAAEVERDTWQRKSKAAESALVDKANRLHEVAAIVNDWWSGGEIAPNAMKAISRVLTMSEAERHAD